jgi:ubiquinone/menaquinone biosynthesis C-methylase UbiE
MNEDERKQLMKATFDAVSEGFDSGALRFFSESAKCMVNYLKGPDVARVLDVATGTGNLALEIARNLPGTHVTGIDFSAGMLSRARAKSAGLSNVEFLEMDMESLEFPDDYFDAVVCAFGIFFVVDMVSQLKHLRSKIRPGGKIVISGFYEDAFQPLIEIFSRRLESYGVERPSLTWKRIATERLSRDLMRDAGFAKIEVHRKELGYYLEDAAEWWQLVWNAGLRSQLNQLSAEDLERFRTEHLEEIDALRTTEGIRLKMEILFTIGVKARNAE